MFRETGGGYLDVYRFYCNIIGGHPTSAQRSTFRLQCTIWICYF